MSSLCDTARAATLYIRGWIDRQPNLQEESITDWMLDFFVQGSRHAKHYQHTRREESVRGADWDWWILPPRGGCCKLRVQAKRLRPPGDHTSGLLHTNRCGRQIDMLLHTSAVLNFLPLYAFYGVPSQLNQCKKEDHPEGAVFLSPAEEVRSLLGHRSKARITSEDLQGISLPMPCIFCCDLLHHNDSRYGPLDVFDHYFGLRDAEVESKSSISGHENEPLPGYEAEVPGIIYHLFELDPANPESDRIFQEYNELYGGTEALLITRIDSE